MAKKKTKRKTRKKLSDRMKKLRELARYHYRRDYTFGWSQAETDEEMADFIESECVASTLCTENEGKELRKYIDKLCKGSF